MKRSPEFLLRDVAGKLVLVPVGSAAARFPGMVTVNPAGKFIWEQLETPKSFDQLVAAMTQRYEVSKETPAADAKAFLERLIAVGAVIE